MIYTLYRDDNVSRQDVSELFDRFPKQRAWAVTESHSHTHGHTAPPTLAWSGLLAALAEACVSIERSAGLFRGDQGEAVRQGNTTMARHGMRRRARVPALHALALRSRAPPGGLVRPAAPLLRRVQQSMRPVLQRTCARALCPDRRCRRSCEGRAGDPGAYQGKS